MSLVDIVFPFPKRYNTTIMDVVGHNSADFIAYLGHHMMY